MSFTLGRVPETFTLVLVRDADFISALRRTDGSDWPATLEATIEILTETPTVWPGTINGPLLEWNVDVVDVEPVYEARPKKVRLWYVDGDVRVLWATGTVQYK